MKLNKILLIFSLIFVVAITLNAIAAADNENINNNLTNELIESDLSINNDSAVSTTENENDLTISDDNQIVSEGIVYIVDSPTAHDPDSPSVEMTEHTIKTELDKAHDGDTLLFKGEYYEHCHLIIDKKLTIISDVATTLNSCTSTEGSGAQGIFYLTPQASGTVIQGFNFKNTLASGDNAYSIFINGASDVIIRDCNFSNKNPSDAIRLDNAKNTIIQNVTAISKTNAIRIKNSQNTILRDSIIKDSKIGVNVTDSTKLTIENNNITNNKFTGIYVGTGVSYITIISNNITYNKKTGVNLQSTNYAYILSNYIAHNRDGDEKSFTEGAGIFINNNITKIEIKGNFLFKNGLDAIYNDEDVLNIKTNYGCDQLEVVENNYIAGHTHRTIFNIQKGSSNPDTVYLGYNYLIGEQLCPSTYFHTPNNLWTAGNYRLQLTNITQIRKGVYSISIVNPLGEVAEDISSIYVNFYLNKNSNNVNPQEGDVYKTVLMKNGTATVRFNVEDYMETGNVLLASFPGTSNNVYSSNNPHKTLEIPDDQIPGAPSNTTISISNINTFPNSGVYAIATLYDQFGNKLIGHEISFKIKSKVINVSTDDNGQAKIKISESKEGTYQLSVSYVGDGFDYLSANATSSIVVKKLSTKIISSNLNMIPKMAEYYSITLKDSKGNPVSGQKVTFKVNGKKYNKKTNSKGVASVKLKFDKDKKTYKISITYAGNVKYKAVSKTNTIKVKYSSKVAKLKLSKVTIPPKTSKAYTITLVDSNGKGISKQNVIVKVNGKTYNKKTNSKGQVKISVKFIKTKNYKVVASYSGSKVYKKASASSVIKVAKTATKITVASKLTLLPNEGKTYTVTLKSNDGKVLSKQKITISLNGKTYAKTTNSKGQISITVKLGSEKSYSVKSKYAGSDIYKASSATSTIVVSKIVTYLLSYNTTFSIDSAQNFTVALNDESGNALANETIAFIYNNQTISRLTDSMGIASINVADNVGEFDIVSKYAGGDKYKSVSNVNRITVLDNRNTVFIDSDLPNSAIQNILDSCSDGANVEFLGDYYFAIALNINKPLNIYSQKKTILNALSENPVFRVSSSNVNISNLIVRANASDAIELNNVCNVKIFNNSISNNLDESRIPQYVESTISLPGYGINISNSSDIEVSGNHIESFESGIFGEYSSNLSIKNNILAENNYGIKYGFGVANTQITSNFITQCIGLYDLTVPEGPRGYGIFLNNSAVNVTITRNNITWNHLGISIDANNSTDIVILSNWISDNVLEGIRFNAGYDLALNAIEPLVTDNAIYRNARGPSMMVLGELSANPFGIYGPGEFNDSLRLQLDANWYGANTLKIWNNENGTVGVGTMCPRIGTTPIYFEGIVSTAPGNYSITFYKAGVEAVNLATFDLFAMINRGTDKEAEVHFYVENGVATFSFNATCFRSTGNVIEISVGSLNDENRIFNVFYTYHIPDSEIPS